MAAVRTQPSACPGCTVRYQPLGSPWVDQKQLLAWHRPVLQCVRRVGVREGGIPGTVRVGGCGRVLYRVPTQYPPGYATLVLPGPNHWLARVTVSPWALQAPREPSAHPWLPHPQIALLGPIRARFRYIYLKVSHNPECHRYFVMRPGILPVSKNPLQKSRP